MRGAGRGQAPKVQDRDQYPMNTQKRQRVDPDFEGDFEYTTFEEGEYIISAKPHLQGRQQKFAAPEKQGG